MSALRKAKNRAAQRLMFVERFNEHTVYHDFFTQFGHTRIYVHKRPKGHGLVCHRVLRCICQTLGITDIHAKLEGAINIQNMTKAFFLGLLKQKTHQQMADEKGLYLVEFSHENDYFPRVVAAPSSSSKLRTEDEIAKDEVLDFDEYINEGKVEYVRPKPPNPFMKQPGWQLHLKKTVPFRNHYDYKVKTVAEYGELTSFISSKDKGDKDKVDKEATTN